MIVIWLYDQTTTIKSCFSPAGVPSALWSTSRQGIDRRSSEKGEQASVSSSTLFKKFKKSKPVQIERSSIRDVTVLCVNLHQSFTIFCFPKTAFWLPGQKVRSRVGSSGTAHNELSEQLFLCPTTKARASHVCARTIQASICTYIRVCRPLPTWMPSLTISSLMMPLCCYNHHLLSS